MQPCSHLHVVCGCFCNALPQQNWIVSAESKIHLPGGVTVGSWTECIWWLPNQTIKFPFCSVATRTWSGHQDLFPPFKAMDKMYHPVPSCRDPLHLLPQAQLNDAVERGIQRSELGRPPRSHSWLSIGISASCGQWNMSENCATGSLSVTWPPPACIPLQSARPRPGPAAQCLVPTMEDTPGPGLQVKCLSHTSHWTMLPVCGAYAVCARLSTTFCKEQLLILLAGVLAPLWK